MKFCVAFLVLLATTYGLPINHCEAEFKEFKEKYNKLYATDDEENLRKNIFCKNLKKIEEHNEHFENGKTTFKMGVNKFSDLSNKEMEQYKCFRPNRKLLAVTDCSTEWENFKNKFNKLYNSEEENLRHQIFCKNFAIIEKNNKDYEQGIVTFKMGVNQFSDLTEEEMKQFMGVLPHKIAMENEKCQNEWTNFKNDFNKLYDSEEENLRFQIFCKNLEIIDKHNQDYEQELATFKMGVNQFSDLTAEEIKQFMGLLPHNILMENDNCQNEWTNFKNNFNKLYDSEEESLRYQIFCKNLKIIEKHNKDYEQGLVTFKMGVNQFSDRTDEEMKQFMGVLPHKISLEDGECQIAWTNYKNNFNKFYDSEDEESQRFQIFCGNFEKIVKHNNNYDQGLVTYKMAVNKFTDMTDEEMKQFMGLIPHKVLMEDNKCRKEWANFKEEYNKLYQTNEEERRRYGIFCNNLDVIEKHNKLYQQGIVSDEFGINQFTDLTAEEMSKYLGFKKVTMI